MTSNVVIIEPSSAGIQLIDASLAFGHQVFILSYNQADRTVPTHYFNQCKIVQVDTNDEVAVRKKLEQLNSYVPIHAILPGFEYYVAMSARLNAYFGLKGLYCETAEAVRFKHKMRQRLLDCGIKTPWFVVIQNLDDLRKHKNKIHFPCVIKPSHLAGSLHITKANTMEELEINVGKLLDDSFLDLGNKMAGDVVIEEYIAGKEYSVEGNLSNDGQIHFVSITDKFLGEAPYFVEVGHIVQACVTPDIKNALLSYARSVIQALNITLGAFHCEMRLSSHGPVLIEIAARLVGDNISELIELATGISLAKEMVKSYLGHPLTANDLSQFIRYAGVQFIYAKQLANEMFSHVDGIEEISGLSGFHRFGLLMKPGGKIYPFTDYRSRVAEVIFTGTTYEEVKAKLALADRMLQVKTIGHI